MVTQKHLNTLANRILLFMVFLVLLFSISKGCIYVMEDPSVKAYNDAQKENQP